MLVTTLLPEARRRGGCVGASGPGRPAAPACAVQLVLLSALLVLATDPVSSGFSRPVGPHKDVERGLNEVQQQLDGPQFNTSDIPTSIHARPGQTVSLPCIVKNLRDKVVLWIRTRDLLVLTHGETVFSSDLRFSVYHGKGGDAWTLKLAGAKPSDSGRYECQVNTDPKMSLAIALLVQEDFRDFPSDQQQDQSVAPEEGGAVIAGPQYVKRGSNVIFNCMSEVPDGAASPGVPFVEWRHNGKLVSLETSRGGGLIVETERVKQRVRSSLTVAAVTQADAGLYTCTPSGARSASINLMLVDEERTEAMQRSGSDRRLPGVSLLITFLAIRGFS